MATRFRFEDKFEQFGHDLRARTDIRYKRRTWGRRPEDVSALGVVQGDLSGRR